MRTPALMIGLALSVLLATPARADDFEEHVARATELGRADQHSEALQEWQAAFALRQVPRIHYDIARSCQSLGQTQDAIQAYERFLSADRGEDLAARLDAEDQLRGLRRLLQPALRTVPMVGEDPRIRYEGRRNRGLMAAGISLLSIGYGVSFITGVSVATVGSNSPVASDHAYATAGGLLVIPVVGPLISSLYLPSVLGRSAAAAWSLPWMMTAAPLQVVGLVMTAIGAKDRHRVPVVAGLTGKVQVAPYAAMGGGGLMAVGRF
jgi:hypothetical protein